MLTSQPIFDYLMETQMRKPAESSMNTKMAPAGSRNVMPPTVSKAPASPGKGLGKTSVRSVKTSVSVPRGVPLKPMAGSGNSLFRDKKF